MLKVENRLTTQFQFNVVRKYGTKYPGELFSIGIVQPRNYEGPTLVGFVVPNTIHKKATKRNRVKRLLREAFRERVGKFPAGNWVVVSSRPKILEKTYEEICDQADRLIQEISIAK